MTGTVNGAAWGVWAKAEGLPVEIVEEFTRTCRVKLLDDLIIDGAVRHKKGSIQIILRGWVTT